MHHTENAAMDSSAARTLAMQILAHELSNIEWVILDAQTIEREFGWVFFYTTRKYWETKNPRFQVAGNAPLLIDRESGKHTFLPTYQAPSKSLEEYAKASKLRP